MGTIILEAQVKPTQRMEVHLPKTMPVGTRVRVTIDPLHPLDWELTEEEQQVWEDFPQFRRDHPFRLHPDENSK